MGGSNLLVGMKSCKAKSGGCNQDQVLRVVISLEMVIMMVKSDLSWMRER